MDKEEACIFTTSHTNSIADLCGYVRRLLGIENAIFNIKPLTLKLGLSKETLNEAVTCEQSEAKQLEMILLRWREAHKNTDDFAVLRKALEGLQPEGKHNLFRVDLPQEPF